MKSPLWIVTSVLAMILVVLLTFIIYSMRTLFVYPATTSIRVTALPEVDKKKEAQPQDLSLIYEEHDLFGTYRPSVVSVKPVDTLPKIPAPPPRIPVKTKPDTAAQFLEPLPFKITGIIASSNEAKSQVSLLNSNTGKTESFKAGDKVLDAYILRIFPTKISIIRSNGQQETLYMYPDEAKTDTTQMQDTAWTDVIQKHGENNYLLNPVAFGSRIRSLSELIDMLDLTTASQNGRPLGIRIGNMKKTSFGFASGLMPGDVIVKIFGIAPTSSTRRLNLFNKVIASDLGDQIPLQYLRDNTVHELTISLFNLADPTATLEGSGIQPLKKAPEKKEPQEPPTEVPKTQEIEETPEAEVTTPPKEEQKEETEISQKVPTEKAQEAQKPEAPQEKSKPKTSVSQPPLEETVQETIVEQSNQMQKAPPPPQEGKKNNLAAMKRYGGKSASMVKPSSDKPAQPTGS